MTTPKKLFTVLLIAAAMLLVSACNQKTPTPQPAINEQPATTEQPAAGLANPASVYCIEQGGQLEIRTGEDGGEYGVCLFPEGGECEEWAYYRGECQPSASLDIPAPNAQPAYINQEYDFSLDPSSDWQIDDTHGDLQYLNFIRNTEDGKRYLLFVGYQRADEEVRPFRSGLGAGEIVEDGSFLFMGAEHPRSLLVLEGKTKTVIYGARIEAGDLRISIYLDPWYESADYRDLEIPAEMIAEADALVASFALLP